jgi:hypothetical protein
MKTWQFWGIQIDFHLSIRRCRRLTYSIPDWADDTHLRQGRISDDGWGTPDGLPKVVYFKGSKAFYIDIPKCKSCQQVYVSPLYDKKRLGFATNRVVIFDIYL